jgi:hypothetical protein
LCWFENALPCLALASAHRVDFDGALTWVLHVGMKFLRGRGSALKSLVPPEITTTARLLAAQEVQG